MSSGVIKPMLAKDGDLSKIKYPVIVQPKLDGIRALVVDGVVRSRTFKPIPNAEIQAALGRPEFNGLDGEIIVGAPTTEGCMQTTSSFVMAPNKTGEAWTYHVFDKWDHTGSYGERMDFLQWGFTPELLSAHVLVVHSTVVTDAAMLERLESMLVSQGHEGVIVRDPSAPYKHGRSGVKGPLLKVKRFIDFEAEILGVYEEQINYNVATKDAFGRTERSTKKANKVGKNALGGFELRAINGPHEGQEFRCGTGFSREQRVALWRHVAVPPPLQKEYGLLDETGEASGLGPLNGKTVKVKSFPVGVKDAPRFPVFLEFRDMEIDG